MEQIKIDECILQFDKEATENYYKNNELCDCCFCRNYYKQAINFSKELLNFFNKFGISIERPDEIVSFENADYTSDYIVYYTVVGKKISSETKHIKLNDFEIFINEQYVPCGHIQSYFCIELHKPFLPWVLDEPFPVSKVTAKKPNIFKRIINFFKK